MTEEECGKPEMNVPINYHKAQQNSILKVMKSLQFDFGPGPSKTQAKYSTQPGNGIITNGETGLVHQKAERNMTKKFDSENNLSQSQQNNPEMISDNTSVISKKFIDVQSPNQRFSDRPFSAIKAPNRKNDSSQNPRTEVGHLAPKQASSSRSTAQTESLASNSSVAPQSDTVPQKPITGKKPDFRIEVERRFNKSITNSVYVFPRRKEKDDEDQSESSDSSIDEMSEVTVYNLKSQNLTRFENTLNKESSIRRLNQFGQETSINHTGNPLSESPKPLKQANILNFKTEGDEPSPLKRPETGKLFKTRTVQQTHSRSIGREDSIKQLKTEENVPCIVSEFSKKQVLTKGSRAISGKEESTNYSSNNQTSLNAGLLLGLQIASINKNKNIASSSYSQRINNNNDTNQQQMNQSQGQGFLYNFGVTVKPFKRQADQTQIQIQKESGVGSDSILYNPRKQQSEHSGPQDIQQKNKKDIYIRQKQLASSVGPNMHQHIMMDYLQSKELQQQQQSIMSGSTALAKPYLKSSSKIRVAIPVSPSAKRIQEPASVSIQVNRLSSSQRARTSDQRLSKNSSATFRKQEGSSGGISQRIQTEASNHRAQLSEGVSSKTLIQGQSVRLLTEGAEPNRSSTSKLINGQQSGLTNNQSAYLGTSSGPLIQSLFSQPQMFTQHHIHAKMQDHVSKSVNFKHPHATTNSQAAPVKITSQVDQGKDKHSAYRHGNSLGMPRDYSSIVHQNVDNKLSKQKNFIRGESSEKSTIAQQQNDSNTRRRNISSKMSFHQN